MSDPEISPSSPPPVPHDETAALQREIGLLLGALLVVSFTLTAFLGLQAHRAGQELDMIQPQAIQMGQAIKNEQPGIQTFLSKLGEYAKTHPDFTVLSQHGIHELQGSGQSNGAPAAAQKK